MGRLREKYGYCFDIHLKYLDEFLLELLMSTVASAAQTLGFFSGWCSSLLFSHGDDDVDDAED